MKIEYKNIKDLIEYKNNPRKNENAIKHVKKSIERFGFKNPIMIDKNNVIVCGHTRFHAAKELNMNELPCIKVSDLNEEQIKAFRIADNRTSEFSEWDFELLEQELKELDNIKPADIGFEEIKNAADFFESEDKESFVKKNDEYDEFVEKFKPEASTDECYTPKEIYDKVCDFVENEYNVSRDNFVRPFYPGGDYQKFKYKDSDIVVDNPPFSIENKIIDFYLENNIKFFIFYNGLSSLNSHCKDRSITTICVCTSITYENNSKVRTSFVTNLDEIKGIRIMKDFINERKYGEIKYKLPDNVIGMKEIMELSKTGNEFYIKKKNFEHISKFEIRDKKHFFGGGIVLSDTTSKYINKILNKNKYTYEFNEKENEIIKRLNEGSDGN